MGTARIAAVLSRAGLHLGRTTVRRMLKRRPRGVAPVATVRSECRIRSSRPNHIWLVDLTTVPTLAGFWISWLPWSVPQRWPFSCWVAVGVDHFSRRIMGVRTFRGRPNAVAMSAFVASTIRAERRIQSSRPNHIWLVDLTTVPMPAGFWISWLPWSVPQRWLFCCWVAVGIDHFSRRIMGVRVFRGRPTAVAMSTFLASTIRAAGQAPQHLITDRGKQFTARAFRRGCRRERGVTLR